MKNLLIIIILVFVGVGCGTPKYMGQKPTQIDILPNGCKVYVYEQKDENGFTVQTPIPDKHCKACDEYRVK